MKPKFKNPLAATLPTRLIVGLAPVLVALAPQAHAAIVTTNETTINGTWTLPSGNNLLNGNTATPAVTTAQSNHGGSLSATTWATLTNNSLGALATFTDSVTPNPNDVVVFPLDISANINGYTITQFDGYGAWQDSGRDDQRYTVQYSTVDAPTTWVAIATVTNNTGGNIRSNHTRLTDDATGILANRVHSIKVVFSATQENNWAGLRELIALGKAVPVLSWAGAAGAGGAANWVTTADTNWLLATGGGAANFSSGVALAFNDSGANRTISVPTALSAYALGFSNSAAAGYAFSGQKITTGKNVIASGAGGVAFNNALEAPGLVLSGSGSISLNAANSTLTGNAAVSAGTLNVGNDLALQAASLVMTGGTAKFTTAAPAIPSLSGPAGSILLGNTASPAATNLTVGNNGATPTTFAGSIGQAAGDVGSLTKTGTCTLVLTNASSYGGATVVNNGILRLEGSGSPIIADNFTAPGTTGSSDLNLNSANRQTGSATTKTWTGVGNMQVGNAGTNVQQPDNTNGDYLLMAGISSASQNASLAGMPLSATNVTGPLKINFDMFKGSTGADLTLWTAFALRGTANNASPVVGSGEFGFLYRRNTGIDVFNNGGGVGTFATTTGGDSFAFYLTDLTGTGSPFGGTGTRVVATQGGTILGSYILNTAMTGSRYLSFGNINGSIVGGVDNLGVNPMQTNILPATTNLSLTASTSGLQLENVSQTVAKFDGVAGSTVAIGPFSNLIVNGGTNCSFAGVLSGGAGGITKSGSSTLTLTATNTYGGTTVLTGGVLNVASLSDHGVSSSLGNRAADSGGNVGLLFRGGTLQYTGSTAQSTNRAIRISTTGGAMIDASGSIPAATLTFTATSSPDFFENAGNRTLALTGTNAGNNTFATAITQTGGSTNLVKNGAGTWVLTGANSFGGTTALNAGILRITTSAGLGAGGFSGFTMTTIANNAALELQGDLTIPEHFHLQGAGPAGLGVLHSLSGNSSLTTNFAIDNNSTFGVDAGTLTVVAQIYHDSGSFGVTKIGAGALVFSGNNIYTGATAINAGSLTVSGGAAIADASAVSLANTSGTVFNLTTSETIGSLAGGGTTGGNVTLGATTLTAGGDHTTTTYAGVISGTGGALVKNGSGTLTLSGVNTYTGDTTVNAGTLAVNGTSIADTNKLVLAGGKLDLAAATNETVNTLYFGAVSQSAGTYGSTSSAATHQDDSRFSGTGILTVATDLYQGWMSGYAAITGDARLRSADPDADGVANLPEYAFGTDPSLPSSGPLTYADGVVTGHGQPIAVVTTLENGVDFRAVFVRRKDYLTAGLTYTVQFSAGLDIWVNSAATPSVLASDATMDAVSVPYPFFIPTANGFNKPTYFRVGVSGN